MDARAHTLYTISHNKPTCVRFLCAVRGLMQAFLQGGCRQRNSPYDLQILWGKMNAQIESLPSPYRKAMVQLRDHFFKCHHHLIVLYRTDDAQRSKHNEETQSRLPRPDALHGMGCHQPVHGGNAGEVHHQHCRDNVRISGP